MLSDQDVQEGVLIVDKSIGVSSGWVVGRVKALLGQVTGHKIKVGHMGTLDPLATGILPLGIGSGTKLMEKFLGMDKEYFVVARIGWETDTEDLAGSIICASDVVPSQVGIETAVAQLTGEILQRPSDYSALKIGGVKAYKLARLAETNILPERRVKVYKIQIESYSYPYLMLTVKCGRGTYIRALVRDIGRLCGTAMHVAALRRTKYGDYTVGVDLEEYVEGYQTQ